MALTQGELVTLAMVGVPATVFSGLSAVKNLLDVIRDRAAREAVQQKTVDDLRRKSVDADGVADDSIRLKAELERLGQTAKRFDKHELECAEAHGRNEEWQKTTTESINRMERKMNEVQRTVANWMRDDEQKQRVG